MRPRAPNDFALDRSRRADGRQVLYFRWASPAPADAPAPGPVTFEPNAGELRWNAPLGEWVIVAPERQDRTFLPSEEACPLCPTRPDGPPTELERPDFEIAVFDNRFPALVADAPEPYPASSATARRAPAIGASEVVVYTPRHDATIASLSADEARNLVAVWLHRTRELGARPDVRYVFIFENRGEAIGVTLHHPHGQIYAYPFVPPVLARELAAVREHRATAGTCLWCEQLAAEETDGSRIVRAGQHWLTGVPFAARWPYEVHLVSRRHVGSLTDLDQVEQDALADAIQDVVRRYDALFGFQLPYVMAVHQSPSPDGGDDHDVHLHVEFYPRHRTEAKLKYLAGSEAGAGVFVGDIYPETIAKRLRGAAG